MKNNELQTASEEEVSLIDLLAILLRYRKFIMCGTAICTFIAAVWLFICPLIFINYFEDKDSFNVSFTIKAINPPSCVMQELGNNTSVAALSQLRMKQLKYILDQNRINSVFKGQDKEGYDYNTYVTKQIDEKKFKVGNVVLGTEFDISCELEEDEFYLFGQYVKSCVDDTNKNLENYIFPIMENIDTEEHPEIVSYKNNYKSFIYIEGEPFILKNEVSKGRIKKLIIAFFASFFVFVFIAFAKNAVKNLKEDSEATAKLTSAWNAGKKAKK